MPEFRVQTTSKGVTHYYENGERGYRCRCGKTHRGDYGAYDYYHHNCFHKSALWDLSYPYMPRRSYLMCPDCGEVFHAVVLSRREEWRKHTGWAFPISRRRLRYLILHPWRITLRKPKVVAVSKATLRSMFEGKA